MNTKKEDVIHQIDVQEDLQDILRLLRTYPNFQDGSHLRALNEKIDDYEQEYGEEVVDHLESALEAAYSEKGIEV